MDYTININNINNINNRLCGVERYMRINAYNNIFKFHRNILHIIIIVRFITNFLVYIIFYNYCLALSTKMNPIQIMRQDKLHTAA